MDKAIKAWEQFWEVLIELPENERESMYYTLANEINACSSSLKVTKREVANA